MILKMIYDIGIYGVIINVIGMSFGATNYFYIHLGIRREPCVGLIYQMCMTIVVENFERYLHCVLFVNTEMA